MRFALAVLLVTSAAGFAADSPKFDRTIGSEPKYTSKPAYCLLAFGPEARHRVWLVRDGDMLYVDKNANGNLTDAGEAVKVTPLKKGREADEAREFNIGEIKLDGKTHKGLTLNLVPVAEFAQSDAGKLPPVRAAIEKDKKALAAMVRCEVEVPGVKGGGTAGRLDMMAGWLDLNGPLQFADKPADAPIIHFGGPLEISFYAELPKMRVGRGIEFSMVVGTSGVGPGTFAMLAYEDCIPKEAYPKAEVVFQPKEPGDAPGKELFELKERC